MTSAIRLIAVLFLLVSGTVTYGQWDGGYGWGGGYHASTAGESYANGMANVIQSQGQANLMNSAAAINVEQARSQNLDNHLKYTNTYFEMRRVNREARAAEAAPQLSSDQLYKIANDNAPKRPTPSQLDPLTGQIAWPMGLRDEQYNPEISKLDQLFEVRAAQRGNIGMSTYNQIQSTCKGLVKLVVANIDQYQPSEYIQAKNFVQGLAYEASFPIQH
ncbi:MAG: hypothetical protein SGJ20_01865 [Planctomycetota bacterium]|nr:hypothetical protein [Planctomycetota bacterium]